MNIYIAVGTGLVIGGYVVYQYFKIQELENRIFETFESIPTAEEMAKEIMKVKLPINELPPSMIEEIRKETTKIKTKDNTTNYFG